MKHFFSLGALAVACFFIMGSNCSKSGTTACVGVEPAAENDSLLAFIARNSIPAIKHSSGIYYQVVKAGTGAVPTATSNVRVQYSGRLLNGNVFDGNSTTSGVSFNLSGVIQGWTIGVPLISSGGIIRLIIPSKYAYGCTGSGGTIPANAPLDFTISLLAVF